jgi:hypothetical protein
MNVVKREPATAVSVTVAFLTAIFGVAVAFGADITQAQQTAILTAVVPTAALIGLVGPVIRQFVRPVATSVSTKEAKEVAQESADIGQPDPLGKL